MPSEYTVSEDRASVHATDVAYDIGRVVQVPGHRNGDRNQHLVKVQIDPDDANSAVWADVSIAAIQDVNIPVEGDTVRIAYEKGGQPVVDSIRYTVENSQADSRLPEYGPGQRRIGHEPTDAHLTLFPDGAVELSPKAGEPLILGGGTQTVFQHEDFTYSADETFYKLEFDAVETRSLTQDQLDEFDIESTDDVSQLPMWDNSTFEWVIPKHESEWREPDQRGSQWTVNGCIRFEKLQQGTLCELGLFIREKNDGPSDGQLVGTRTAHASASQSALTIPYSFTERFPQESRLSLHVRSKSGGGIISSNALTQDGSPQNIQSDAYGSVENWDMRFPRVRQSYCAIEQTG